MNHWISIPIPPYRGGIKHTTVDVVARISSMRMSKKHQACLRLSESLLQFILLLYDTLRDRLPFSLFGDGLTCATQHVSSTGSFRYLYDPFAGFGMSDPRHDTP